VGGPAPWADVDHESVTIAGIRKALEAAGPPVASSREGHVARASAVLAPLYDGDDGATVVLTRRSWHLRAHKGEVSFPGGGQDAGESLTDTARREAWEETGLDPASVEIIGELDHLTTFTSQSFIVPFVGSLPGRPALAGNPAEVEAILHVPLRELLRPDVFHEEVWPLWGEERRIFFFELAGDTVWGATAAMLRQLLGLATGTLGRGQLDHL
jgi:8-oxo-dGTP pyrophosphatase MutT (NUDIX family)